MTTPRPSGLIIEGDLDVAAMSGMGKFVPVTLGNVTHSSTAALAVNAVVVGNGNDAIKTIVTSTAASTGYVLTYAGPSIAPFFGPAPGGLTIEEVDGAPTVAATKLVVPNGTLSASSGVATLAALWVKQSTGPTTPFVGLEWVNDTEGIQYRRYDDGTTTQWVEF